MLRRALLSGPLLAALLVLVAPDPPAAHSAAGAAPREEPPSSPYPAERERDTRCHVCRLAERVGLRMTPLARVHRHRCGEPPEPDLSATAPRGRVRMADLAHLRVDVGLDLPEAFFDDPYVELRCGDTPLGRVRLRGELATEYVTLPPALRAKLAGLRGRITWGRADLDGPQAVASIWIDPPSREEQRVIADIHRRLADEPTWIRQVLEAQALLDQEFDGAALELARAVLARRVKEPHAAAIVHAAYALMGLADLGEAVDHKVEVMHPLHEQRRRSAASCHLDAEAPPLRSRAKRPRGGCGSR